MKWSGTIARAKRTPQAGDVWWCNGAALQFEAHFKSRPVLVVAVESAVVVHVMPLSSRRRFGQEQAVTHTGGVSYMTGAITAVPASSLFRYLGPWGGFPEWQAQQRAIAEAMGSGEGWFSRLLRQLLAWWKRDTAD